MRAPVAAGHASRLIDTRVFRDGRWRFDDDNADLHALHHLGGGVFAVPGRFVRGRVLDPAPPGP